MAEENKNINPEEQAKQAEKEQKEINDAAALEKRMSDLETLVASMKAEMATFKKQVIEDPKAKVRSASLPETVEIADLKKIWSTHLPENTPFDLNKFSYHFPKQMEDKPYTLTEEKGGKTAKVNYL